MNGPVDAGFRPAAGTSALSGGGERLALAWLLFLRRLLARGATFVTRAPALLPADVLRRSAYLEHFPQNVLTAVPHEAPTRPASLALSPACCLHVFEAAAGERGDGAAVHGVVHGPCARYEGGGWSPGRLSQFTMVEWVAWGSAESVAQVGAAMEAEAGGALDALGLTLEAVEATDPFFGGSGSGEAVMQKLLGAKREWRTPSGAAVGSVNRHGDVMGRRFDIMADGAPAHSMCIAFGVERLVREGVAVWGESVGGWPEELRAYGALP